MQAKTQPRDIAIRRMKMRSFMYNHPVGVLTTVTPNHDPHGSVIYYAPDENNNVLFFTKALTRKHDNIIHNHHVMLVAYDPEDQVVLQMTGSAEIISDALDRQVDFAAVMTASMQASGYPFSPISKVSAGAYVVYKIHPSQMRLTTYGHPGHGVEVLEGAELIA